MAKVIYVTGFGPFPGIDRNPTGEIAEALHGHTIEGYRIASEVLPTSFSRASECVRLSIAQHKPKLILHFGLNVFDTIIRVESWAANEMSARFPDIDGVQPFEQPYDETDEYKAVYQTNFSVPDVVESIRAFGFPARPSRNAGRYVCNGTYYGTLSHLDRSQSSSSALFVHLPAPGLRPFGDPGFAPWDRELLLDAAVATIQAVARNRP